MIQRKYIKATVFACASVMIWALAGCGSTVEPDQKNQMTTEPVIETTADDQTEAKAVTTAEGQEGTEDSKITTSEENQTSEAQAASNDASWYEEVLSDGGLTFEYGGEPYHVGDYNYYALIDLAGDGIPELVLSTTEDSFLTVDDRAIIVSQDGGTRKVLGAFHYEGGCSLYCNKKEGKLGWYTRGSGQANSYVYSLEDGSLKEIESLDAYQPYHDPEKEGVNEESTQYLNGKEVSQEEYDEEFKKYFSDDAALTYVTINR